MSFPTVPLSFRRHPPPEMSSRSRELLEELRGRRSVREFSPDPVPLEVLRACVETAAQAPSGANKQPWTFVLVTDPGVKKAIRAAAEEEERAFYAGRASDRWLEDLAPLGTDPAKPFLEVAPALIVLFAQRWGPGGKEQQHYYVTESVGIAAGFLIAALHHAGLATLTHTPSPMNFLGRILRRPDHERAFLLLPVGFPAAGARVPDIQRRSLADVLVEV